jgi:pimeloyl-ACP methyl ester carboxylesterase
VTQLARSFDLAPARSVAYEVIGKGEPLLWIEGGPGFPACMGRPDVKLLQDSFTCYLVDAPGCGGSSPPARKDDYDHLGHVRFFEEVRVALDLGPLTVMGHSWGGLIALLYAALVPDAVRRCVVVDGYAGEASVPSEVYLSEQDRAFARLRDYDWLSHSVAAWDQLGPVGDRTPAQWEEAFWPCWPLYFAYPETSQAQAHIARLRRDCRVNVDVMRVWDRPSLSELDVRPQLADIDCPTLVLVGEHDFICGPSWANAVASNVPDAELVLFEDCGHMPQYEHPERFAITVLRWCESHPGTAGGGS